MATNQPEEVKNGYNVNWKAVQEILSIHNNELSSGAKVVYLFLLLSLGHKDHCWPGMKTIGLGTGLSPRIIQEHINTLGNMGLVEIERGGIDRRTLTGHRSNHYKFTSPIVKRDKKHKYKIADEDKEIEDE